MLRASIQAMEVDHEIMEECFTELARLKERKDDQQRDRVQLHKQMMDGKCFKKRILLGDHEKEERLKAYSLNDICKMEDSILEDQIWIPASDIQDNKKIGNYNEEPANPN